MSRSQGALWAAAWIVTAIAAGLLASFLLAPQPGLVVAGSPAASGAVDPRAAPAPPGSPVARRGERREGLTGTPTGAADRNATPAPGSGPGDVPDAAGSAPDSTRGEEAAPASAVADGPAGWIEVRVTREDGTPAEAGTVYALPAGEPGTDAWQEIPQADVVPDGFARLAVPSAGTYDVGYVGEAQALRTDLAVTRGGVARVDFTIPTGRRITFRCDKPPPDGGVLHVALAPGGTEPHEGPRAGADEEFAYPGRGQRYTGWTHARIGPDGLGRSHPLDPGRVYRISASVGRDAPYGVVPQREFARPGEEVLLRIRPQARLSLTFRVEGRPENANWFRLLLERSDRPGRESLTDQTWQRLVEQPAPLVRWVAPGKGHITWQGGGLLPGSTEDFTLAEGTTVEKEIVIRPVLAGEGVTIVPDGEPAVPAPRLRVTVEGIPASGVPESASFCLLARLAGPPASADYYDHDPAEPTLEINEEWQSVKHVLAVLGARLASDPTPVAPDGQVAVRLRPAGLLVVVPERPAVPGMGALTVEREDGLPIPTAPPGDLGEDFTVEDWSLGRIELAPRVGPGTILGPFPEGTIRLRVRQGRVRLATIAASVKAGALRPLVISR